MGHHWRSLTEHLTEAEVQRVAAHFVDPAYKALDDLDESLARLDAEHPASLAGAHATPSPTRSPATSP